MSRLGLISGAAPAISAWQNNSGGHSPPHGHRAQSSSCGHGTEGAPHLPVCLCQANGSPQPCPSPTPSSSYTPEHVAAHLTALPSGSGFCSHQPWARQDAAQTTAQASCQGCSSQLLTGSHPTHCDVKATTILKSFPGASCIKMQVEMEVSGTTYSQLSHLGPLLSLQYLWSCWTFIPAVCEAQLRCPRLGSALEMPYGHDSPSHVSLPCGHPHMEGGSQGWCCSPTGPGGAWAAGGSFPTPSGAWCCICRTKPGASPSMGFPPRSFICFGNGPAGNNPQLQQQK